MSPQSPFDSLSRRLAVYGYLAPLFQDRRVLELSCGDGLGAARVRALGAASVLGLDADAAVVARARQGDRVPGLEFAAGERRSLEAAGPFDLILVPDGAAWLSPAAPVGPAAISGLLHPNGRLVVLAASADRGDAATGEGVGYYALVDELERLFPHVRMFGLTPFAAFGAAEFGADASGLRIESGLVEEGSEQPSHYLALAGPDDGVDLGYALLQVPASESLGSGAAPAEEPSSAELLALRRNLAEAEGKAEGAARVSRAQADEIEELRGRLRRGAEGRRELDDEVARLRRALGEADAAVLDLTRRTREEVAALARQIGASGRPPQPAPAAQDKGEDRGEGAGMQRLREELRRRSDDLAARESALSERDQRIATLETEKQELLWRLQAVASEPSEAPASAPQATNGAAHAESESAEEAHHREQAQLAAEQYRQAATAHLDEVNRLREALAEQSTLVSELEDALAATTRRLQAGEGELERLRRHAAEVEQADRARRSRLAEVEGTLLRLQRQTAAAAAAAVPVAPIAPVVPVVPVAPPSSAELEEATREIGHLREALDRTEEQLWETKGQMLLDRERLNSLELQLAASQSEARENPAAGPTVSEAAHHAILAAVMEELAEIELGVRLEIGKLDSLEHVIDGWRSDLPVVAGATNVPVPSVD